MDPDANLKEQRILAQRIALGDAPADSETMRLAKLVLALDQWLRHGGFLPGRWDPQARSVRPLKTIDERWRDPRNIKVVKRDAKR